MKTRNSVKKRNCQGFLLRRTIVTTINSMRLVNTHFTVGWMRNRRLSVENQHMVNFSSAVWVSMTSHLNGKLFQRRSEAALNVEELRRWNKEVRDSSQHCHQSLCPTWAGAPQAPSSTRAWRSVSPLGCGRSAPCKCMKHLASCILLLLCIQVTKHHLPACPLQELDRKHKLTDPLHRHLRTSWRRHFADFRDHL